MTPTPSPRAHAYLHALSNLEQLAIADQAHEAFNAGRVPSCEWPDGDRGAQQEAAECAMLGLVVVRIRFGVGVDAQQARGQAGARTPGEPR